MIFEGEAKSAAAVTAIKSVVNDIVVTWPIQNKYVRLAVFGKIVRRCFLLICAVKINDADWHVYCIC